MRQQGKEWITPEGTKTTVKYLPDYVKKSEQFGSRVAAIMTDIEESLERNKLLVNELCMNMFKHYQAEHPGEEVKRFSFTSFDREYKIEVDLDKNYIRCYRATKRNPKASDYELVNTDFARSGLKVHIGGAVAIGTPIEMDKSHGSLESAAGSYVPAPPELFQEEENITK